MYIYIYIYIYVFKTEKITQFYVTFRFTAFSSFLYTKDNYCTTFCCIEKLYNVLTEV